MCCLGRSQSYVLASVHPGKPAPYHRPCLALSRCRYSLAPGFDRQRHRPDQTQFMHLGADFTKVKLRTWVKMRVLLFSLENIMEEENENDERYRKLCVEMFLFHHFRFFFVFVSCCLFLTLYAHSTHNTQTISHYDSNSSSIYQQHSYKRVYLQRFFR